MFSTLRIFVLCTHIRKGKMLEWLKRHAWKACSRLKRLTGSNPVLSADSNGMRGWKLISAAHVICCSLSTKTAVFMDRILSVQHSPPDPVAPGELETGPGLVQRAMVRGAVWVIAGHCRSLQVIVG